MARVTAEKVEETKRELLDAARTVLTVHGFAGLSTRRVAEVAETQMSQIRYHFGSKQGLILAVFHDMNEELLARQARMFRAGELALSDKWDLACDFLEEDLKSGYVRVFQELIAAGWSDPEIRAEMQVGLRGWFDILTETAANAAARDGRASTFRPEEIAALVSAAFIGAEAQILLGIAENEVPLRASLRRVGDLIRTLENGE